MTGFRLTHRSARLALAGCFVLLFALIGQAATAPPSGKWLAEDINGGGVIDRLQTTMEINDDGIVTGSGGCNRYAGSAKIDGPVIQFLPMASTRMACPPAAMNQEDRFHKALEKVRAWRIDEPQRKLFLLDKDGFNLIRFSRMD